MGKSEKKNRSKNQFQEESNRKETNRKGSHNNSNLTLFNGYGY
jgi:hypothetical protein